MEYVSKGGGQCPQVPEAPIPDEPTMAVPKPIGSEGAAQARFRGVGSKTTGSGTGSGGINLLPVSTFLIEIIFKNQDYASK